MSHLSGLLAPSVHRCTLAAGSPRLRMRGFRCCAPTAGSQVAYKSRALGAAKAELAAAEEGPARPSRGASGGSQDARRGDAAGHGRAPGESPLTKQPLTKSLGGQVRRLPSGGCAHTPSSAIAAGVLVRRQTCPVPGSMSSLRRCVPADRQGMRNRERACQGAAVPGRRLRQACCARMQVQALLDDRTLRGTICVVPG